MSISHIKQHLQFKSSLRVRKVAPLHAWHVYAIIHYYRGKSLAPVVLKWTAINFLGHVSFTHAGKNEEILSVRENRGVVAADSLTI